MAYSRERLVVMMSAEYRQALSEIRDYGEYPNDSALFDAAMALLAEKLEVELPPRVNPIGDWRARHAQEKSEDGT